MLASWRESISIYLHPRVAAMMFLGFAAGLPYLLVFTTLTAWLTEEGVSRASIGFFSWVGITYSVKVFWSPIVDRLKLPLLGAWLGQRRSWILLGQLMIAGGLIGMSMTEPSTQLMQLAFLALLVAFGSATQDIAIDAWRIEAVSTERQAAMSAVYVFAYRIALLVAGAGALHLVSFASWPGVYLIMALLMGVGMVTVLLAPEPDKTRTDEAAFLEQRAQDYLARSEHVAPIVRRAVAWFIGAVVCPFVDFFKRYGKQSLLLLLIVGLYRVSDISMGSMAMPFYLDLGFTRGEVANIAGVWGIGMTIVGGLTAGLLVPRYGLLRLLLAGAILSAATNLLFTAMALVGPELWMLTITISGDNFFGGMAMAVLIAWLSSLTSSSYTATQYALFSSLMTLPGKFIGGFSGLIVTSQGYAVYFVYVAAIGVPACLLVWYLIRQIEQDQTGNETGPTAVSEQS